MSDLPRSRRQFIAQAGTAATALAFPLVGGAQQTISARLADAQVATHLGVAVGSALLAVRRLIHDEQGRPVQWLHGLYRPDRYQYQMRLSRVGSIDAKVWVSEELSAQFH